jgi:hypothetical protein
VAFQEELGVADCPVEMVAAMVQGAVRLNLRLPENPARPAAIFMIRLQQ